MYSGYVLWFNSVNGRRHNAISIGALETATPRREDLTTIIW